MKKVLFGEINLPSKIMVFHDESGDYGHTEWVFTGLLWVNASLVEIFDGRLKEIRKKHNYNREIHYNKFPKSFKGDYGVKARVAKDWFDLWRGELSEKSWFNVLAIHRDHPKYDHSKFSKDFHAYNRFMAIALKSGLNWFFKDREELPLTICSDGKIRRRAPIITKDPDGTIWKEVFVPNGITEDNFEEYVPKKIKNEANVIIGKIKCIECPEEGPYKPEEELLQLSDLLLGAVATAIHPKTTGEAKLWFAKEIAPIMEDTRSKPWEQRYGLHKKFSVSYFPNNEGKMYSNGPIKIIENKNQLALL